MCVKSLMSGMAIGNAFFSLKTTGIETYEVQPIIYILYNIGYKLDCLDARYISN